MTQFYTYTNEQPPLAKKQFNTAELDSYIVHATNPQNFSSIIHHKTIFPNKQFPLHGIVTPLAKRINEITIHNDDHVYFAHPVSHVAENAINCTTRSTYDPRTDTVIPLNILPIRLYFNRELVEQRAIRTHVSFKEERSELKYRGPFPIFDCLEAILIPESANSLIPAKLSDKTVILFNLTKEYLQAHQQFTMPAYTAIMNDAFLQFKNGVLAQQQKESAARYAVKVAQN